MTFSLLQNSVNIMPVRSGSRARQHRLAFREEPTVRPGSMVGDEIASVTY